MVPGVKSDPLHCISGFWGGGCSEILGCTKTYRMHRDWCIFPDGLFLPESVQSLGIHFLSSVAHFPSYGDSSPELPCQDGGYGFNEIIYVKFFKLCKHKC